MKKRAVILDSDFLPSGRKYNVTLPALYPLFSGVRKKIT